MSILDVMRRTALIGAVAACLAAAGCASDEQAAPQRATVAAAPAPATELPPLPEDHEAKVVEPVAGDATPEPKAAKPDKATRRALQAAGAADAGRFSSGWCS